MYNNTTMSTQPFEHQNYLALPKSIGQVDSDTLLAHARTNEREEEIAVTTHTKAELAQVAGSNFIEAALTIDDPSHDHDDYRLGLLDDGQAALARVIAYEEELMETGQKSPDDHVELLRAMLGAAFMNVYADMICGEVTSDTKSEIIGFLNKHINLTSRLRSELSKRHGVLRSNLSGLLNEMRVLLDTWERYQRVGDKLATPASNRADNGTYLKSETHDIAYFTQHPDTTFELSHNEEVKTKSSFLKNNLGYLIRYDNQIAVVDKDGSLTRY